MNYSIKIPSKIFFGSGSIRQLADVLPPGGRVLLVHGRHFAAEKVKDILRGFSVHTYCGVQSEAPLPAVDELIRIGRQNDIKSVVAIGGGSVIDVAKAAAALIPTSGNCAQYFYGDKAISAKGCFFAALPTTSGTGAEITANAVLLDPGANIKKSLRHESMVPDVAIVDPDLTVSCPFALTAASGLDAMTQAIESYISKNANNTSKALALKAVDLIAGNLETACFEPENQRARSSMAEGSMITGLAFSQSSLGAVHGIGHVVGAVCHVAHGVCCAVLLPHILEFNRLVCADDLDVLAASFAAGSGGEMIEKIRDLNSKLNIPDSFSGYGLEEKHFPFILANCRSGSMKSNPRYMEDANIVELLNKLSV